MDNETQSALDRLGDAVRQINDSMLTISGTVLGFSVAFLTVADSLELTVLLRIAWVALAAAIISNVGARYKMLMVLRPNTAVGQMTIFSGIAFLIGLTSLMLFGLFNV